MASKVIGSKHKSIPMIESQELAFFIVSKKEVLLIDSRSLMEFNSQSIQKAVNVSCSKLLKRRLQQDKISVSELLQGVESKQPISMDPKTMVVVYDHCTEHVRNLPNEHFVYLLLCKLSSHYEEVLMLKGGIVDFQTHYPNMCERRTILPLDLTPRVPLPKALSPGVDTVDGSCSSTKTSPFLTAMSVPVSNIGPTRILDHLYLGSQTDAMDADVLRANGVTHVLNVSSNPKTPHVLENFFYRIEVNDGYVDNFLPHFQKGFLFLEKVREAGGRALVHCLAGISRSPTLAIAYLMQYLHMSSDDAYRYVKERRANIAPNFNFLGQLLEFERQLNEKRIEEAAMRLNTPSPVTVTAMDSSATISPTYASTVTPPTSFLSQTSCSTVMTASTASSSTISPSSASTSSTPIASPCPVSRPHPVPAQLSCEGGLKKKRPCLNRPSFFPAEKKSAKSSNSPPAAKKHPPISHFCAGNPAMRPRTLLPPSTLSFPVGGLRPQTRTAARQSRLELPRSATVGQISSPTTAFARLTFDSAGQFSRFPTTSLDKLSFMPCHSAMDSKRQVVTTTPTSMQTDQVVSSHMPRSRSAIENLGTGATRPPWLNLRSSHTTTYESTHSSSSSSSSSSRMRSPLTPRKQLSTISSPLSSTPGFPDPLMTDCQIASTVVSRDLKSEESVSPGSAGRKSRSLEDMIEGLVPSSGSSVCFVPEGGNGRRSSSGRNGATSNDTTNFCRLTDHSLHHSSSSLSSSAASGSQHSSMHSSMEILQVS